MRIAWYSILMLLVTVCTFGSEPLKNIAVIESLSPVSPGEIVEHTYYKLSYSEKDEQAYWVYYMLTPEFLNSSIKRSDDFRADPSVKTGSATPPSSGFTK